MKSPILDIYLDNFYIGNVYGVILLDYRNNPDGLYNVRYRLTFKRDRKYISTGYSYSLHDWERLNSNKIKDDDIRKAKRDLINNFSQIKDKIDQIVNVDRKPFTFEELMRRISKGNKNDVFVAIDKKIIKLNKEGRVSTAVTYISTLGSLWEFVNEYKGKESFSKLYKRGEWQNNSYKGLPFERISEDFVKRYKYHLTSIHRSDATIGIYLRNLRAILNENDIPAGKYPFGKNKISIPNGSSRKIALSKDIITLINNHPLFGNRKMYRDLWIFSYLCNGANLKDIFRLKFKNIQGNFIYFKRAKTERTSKDPKEIKVSIHPQMQKIISEYGNNLKDKDKDKYIFPFLNHGIAPAQETVIIADYDRRINRAMKVIAKDLNLNANITLYSARHSYAVNSERSGQRTSLISKALGHSNISVTVSYLESFDDSEIIDNSNRLL